MLGLTRSSAGHNIPPNSGQLGTQVQVNKGGSNMRSWRQAQVLYLIIHFSIVLGVHAQSPSGSYAAAFRTPKHVKLSKPEVFHTTVEEVVHYLETNNVYLVTDPLRARIETQDPISIESLVRITKDAGASYLLYITVDRPVTQWLKVTVECYDLDQKMLWRESAGYTGLTDVNSKKALPEIIEKLEKQLAPRMGKPGLMPKPESTSTPAVAGENPQ